MTWPGDSELLLAQILMPSSRVPDTRFAGRVRLAVAEERRYRLARRAARQRVVSDLLVLIGLVGLSFGIARALAATGVIDGPAAAVAITATIAMSGWIVLSDEFRRVQLS